MVDKKAINYYRSFYDVSKDLNQKQFYDFNMAVYSVMFFDKHIDEVEFTDKMMSLLWKSVKHSVRASVDGYCTKKGTPYDSLFDPLAKPLGNNEEEEEQGKEQVQGKEQCETSLVVLTPSQETALFVADYLLYKIVEAQPTFKQPKVTSNWVKDIDLAIRIDNRTKDQLIGCINWMYSKDGSFWIPHIRSGKKLREKFDTMESQMMSKSKKNDIDFSWMDALEAENAS